MAIETLQSHEVFKHLRPKQIDIISSRSRVIPRVAGEIVYKAGSKADFLYSVLKGQVTLRMTGQEGLSVVIDHLDPGAMFGGCISCDLQHYATTAQCVKDGDVLQIDAAVLRRVMEDDPRIGYIIQSRISEIYFRRYLETMKKLQSIVMSMPIERH